MTDDRTLWQRLNTNAPNALPQIPFRQIIFRRSFLVAALAYLAVLLALYYRLFSGDFLHSGANNNLSPPFQSAQLESLQYANIFDGDFVQQFSVFEEYQYRAAQEGRFPTWNPHIYGGQPFHADGQ